MPRKYSMERRSSATEETRQRIVAATVELHSEKGISATSMQEIAARAGVALGTVYRHFPTVDDLVPACGGRILELFPPPGREVFSGLESGVERVIALVDALFTFYEEARRPLEAAFAEAQSIPALQEFISRLDASLRELVAEAVAPIQPEPLQLRLAVALSDFYTWRSLARAGFSRGEAAQTIASVIAKRLKADERDRV